MASQIAALTERPGETPLIEVIDLTIDFWSGDRWVNVVADLTLDVRPGEALGLVGESGCGKTTTAFALLGERRANSRIRRGQVLFVGRDLLRLPASELRHIRGRQISFVPQNPTTALSPGIRVGAQLIEAMAVHDVGRSYVERRNRAHELLDQVQLPDPVVTAGKYPHELSGGQQQRVTIAMALACAPKLVVLDEPTTGLDVTTQAQILDLLGRLRHDLGMAFLYVTHNLGVVAQLCDRVAVLYAGHLVENAPTSRLFAHPRHPYTRGLIDSVPSVVAPHKQRSVLLRGFLQRDALPEGCRFAPRCDFAEPRCLADRPPLEPTARDHLVACWRSDKIADLIAPAADRTRPPAPAAIAAPLLIVENLHCSYDAPRWRLFRRAPHAVVRDVTIDVHRGETLALVGESGSGKSTIARTIGGVLAPLSGKIRFEQNDVAAAVGRRPQQLLREIQLVLQNPDASLNPRQRVSQIIGRPLELFWSLGHIERDQRTSRLLEDVRLDRSFARRYPDELSGGERQRVAIARALAADPKLLLCDEVLSALDVSVQADIMELLRALQRARQIAYLFISHDLAVVRSLSHRVAVLYHGELCETGLTEEVYAPPLHPYTAMLLAAVPEVGTEGRPNSLPRTELRSSETGKPQACPFADRCPRKVGSICDDVAPPWQRVSATHMLRCHIKPEELK